MLLEEVFESSMVRDHPCPNCSRTSLFRVLPGDLRALCMPVLSESITSCPEQGIFLMTVASFLSFCSTLACTTVKNCGRFVGAALTAYGTIAILSVVFYQQKPGKSHLTTCQRAVSTLNKALMFIHQVTSCRRLEKTRRSNHGYNVHVGSFVLQSRLTAGCNSQPILPGAECIRRSFLTK